MSDMKPLVFDAALTDPLDVARRDNVEYFIDKISTDVISRRKQKLNF